MDLDKIQEISEKAVSYFKKRRYIVGDVYLNRETHVSRSESEFLDAVDFNTSVLNPISSLGTIAYDLSQAEQQFNALKTWITETLEDSPQVELTPALMPALCHIYLDCLRIHPQQDCINFFMSASVNLITEEWFPYVEQLLNITSANDYTSHPLVKAFRESKFKLKLVNDNLVLLRKFLTAKDLNIIIGILQRWFEFDDDEEEEEESDEENSECNRIDEPGAASSEEESPMRTVRGQYAKQIEELMKDITAKRLQSTPPPPLLLYTAFRTEGIVCGRISEGHCLAATGDKRSEVRIWGIGENRMNPKFHDSYFQSVPLGEIDSDTDSQCSGEHIDITSDELQDLTESQLSSCAPSTSKTEEDITHIELDKRIIEEKSGEEESNDSGSEECSDAEKEFMLASLASSSKTSPTAVKPKIDLEQRQPISPSGHTNDQDSVYSVETGDTIGFNSVQQMWPLHGHSDAVYDVAFIPNNDYLLSVSFDTTMRLWNLNDFSCPVVYRGHSSPVWSVAISSLDNYVATASSDKTAKLWCLDRTYPVRVMAGHLQAVTCVAFHPNGSYMATGSPDRTVRLWSITDGSMVRCMGGISDMGSVETLTFSPNGQYVASAGEDQCVWVWDLASGNYILKLTGHTCRIVSIDWSNDGSTVSAASLDGTILLWALDNKDACSGNVVPKKYETGCAYLLSLEYSRNNGLLAFGLKERVS